MHTTFQLCHKRQQFFKIEAHHSGPMHLILLSPSPTSPKFPSRLFHRLLGDTCSQRSIADPTSQLYDVISYVIKRVTYGFRVQKLLVQDLLSKVNE